MHRNELQADFHAIFKDIYLKVVAYKRHYRIVYAYKTLLNILFCNDTKIIYGHESVHTYIHTHIHSMTWMLIGLWLSNVFVNVIRMLLRDAQINQKNDITPRNYEWNSRMNLLWSLIICWISNIFVIAKYHCRKYWNRKYFFDNISRVLLKGKKGKLAANRELKIPNLFRCDEIVVAKWW